MPRPASVPSGVAFAYYPVRDLRRAERFYRGLLGLSLKVREGPWVEFGAGGFRLAVRRERSRGAVVFLEVPDIRAAARRLARRGVRFARPVEFHSYGALAEFLDPDGNRVGLYEKPRRAAGISGTAARKGGKKTGNCLTRARRGREADTREGQGGLPLSPKGKKWLSPFHLHVRLARRAR